MQERQRRVIVTGGAGFIGSHLCEALLRRGAHVLCVDNLFTGSRANIKHLLERDDFELIRHDIVEPLVLDADAIFNLACPASPVHYQHNPVKTIQTNVVGAYNVLELARQTRARVLQASTSEVYGDPDVHPQPETYWGHVNPVGPRSCYDEGKRCAETLFNEYHRQVGVDVRIARIFNTYGPRMALDDGRVVSNFIVQALRGEPITIYGDGRQTRSFCFVDDLVEGLLRLMDFTGDGASEPVNLGSPAEMSIGELARLIVELCGTKSSVEFHPLPTDDPRQRRPDIARATKLLDWSPTIAPAEGLARTVEYFRRVLQERS